MQNNMNIAELQQYTCDTKAERHRIGYKRNLTLMGYALWAITAVVGVCVYLATHNGSWSIISAPCEYAHSRVGLQKMGTNVR